MSDFVYYNPKNKSVKNDGNMKIISETGKTALMCPECFHTVITYASFTKVYNDVLDKIEDFCTSNENYGVCPNCNEGVKFEIIDINMAQIINILNTKGYYTAFCCEGHIEPDEITSEVDVTLPYVYFYLWKDSKVLETNPLPDTWYITDDEKECNTFVIRDNICKSMPKSIIDGNEIYNLYEYNAWLKVNWNKESRIRDLYEWAVNLPDKDKTVKNSDKYLIKKFGQAILLQNSERFIEYSNKK